MATDTIDVSRLSEGVNLSPEVSSQILAATLDNSFAQTLATKVEMPGTGLSYQTITGEPEAAWVDETAEKPVSRPSFGADRVQPYKMAVIVPFSDEFRRDAKGLFAEVQRRLPKSLGRLFDRTVLGLTEAPGEFFDTLDGAQAVEFDATDAESAYNSLVDVEEAVANGGGFNTGWALSPASRVRFLRVTDGAGNATLTAGQDLNSGALLNVPTVYNRHVAEVDGLMGIAGDWQSAEWGAVEGVRLSAADQATLTEIGPDGETRTLNLWQRNMFALRCEIEVSFKADAAKFARLVQAGA